MIQNALKDVTTGASLFNVWVYQAYHDVSSKYKRTVLGSIWISGGMVATSLALAIVMGGIQGQSLPDALPYIMCGILCFALPGYILGDAPEVYMSASNIIKNHAYPFSYYAFESVTRVFIIFLYNLVAFYIVMFALNRAAVPHWSLLPALFIVYANCIFWGTLMSMVAARFRDLRFLLPFVNQIAFFMTPVFWRAENLTGWRTHIVNFNPFYGLLEITRAPLMGYAAPEIAWSLSLGSLGAGVVLWSIFFNIFRGKIAFWV
jgi:ABC-type polysaccharide/polyol phosphate export permease